MKLSSHAKNKFYNLIPGVLKHLLFSLSCTLISLSAKAGELGQKAEEIAAEGSSILKAIGGFIFVGALAMGAWCWMSPNPHTKERGKQIFVALIVLVLGYVLFTEFFGDKLREILKLFSGQGITGR